MKLIIENKFYESAFEYLGNILGSRFTHYEKLEQAHELVKKSLPFFKCGIAGSHVWISLHDNERIALITKN